MFLEVDHKKLTWLATYLMILHDMDFNKFNKNNSFNKASKYKYLHF